MGPTDHLWMDLHWTNSDQGQLEVIPMLTTVAKFALWPGRGAVNPGKDDHGTEGTRKKKI